jgi:hypothetical protein
VAGEPGVSSRSSLESFVLSPISCPLVGVWLLSTDAPLQHHRNADFWTLELPKASNIHSVL